MDGAALPPTRECLEPGGLAGHVSTSSTQLAEKDVMKRTSSGTPPRSPSPSREVTADSRGAAPSARRTRVRAEWNGMHHPGRRTVAVLVVGGSEKEAVSQQLDAWRQRAREVEHNYCVIEAGDATEDPAESAGLLRQHMPADAEVLVLQADETVTPDDVEHAQDALSHAGFARRASGPFLANDEGTNDLPVFPSEAQLLQQALMQVDAGTAFNQAVDVNAELAFEARQRSTSQLHVQRQMDELRAAEQRVEAQLREMLGLVAQIADLLPEEPAPPLAVRQLIDSVQCKPHWQASALTPQAGQLMALLLRLGQGAWSDPAAEADVDSPERLALQAIVTCMRRDGAGLAAVLAAVDQWPADGTDHDRLTVLLGAVLGHEVGPAAGLPGGVPVNDKV